MLKVTYFSAGTPGPGVLLFHRANVTRTSWDGVARQLATSGINTVAADAVILNQLEVRGGAAQVTQQLIEARKRDPKAQLFPDVSLNIIREVYGQIGEPRTSKPLRTGCFKLLDLLFGIFQTGNRDAFLQSERFA